MTNWQRLEEDDFTRSGYPTAANSAGGTNIGAPDVLGSGNWTDLQGGVAVITAANVLQLTNDSVNANSFQRDHLLRPSTADLTRTSQRIVFTTVAQATNSGTFSWGCSFRYQSALIYYGVFITNGQLQLWRMNNGTNVQVTGSPVAITGFDSRNVYVVDASIEGTTTPVFNITVQLSGVTKASMSTVSDASAPAALQGTGRMGLIPFSGTGLVNGYSKFVSYYDAGTALAAGSVGQTAISSTSVSLSAGAATGGTGPYTYQWKKSVSGPNGTYSNIGGATSLTLTDSPSQGVLTCYRIYVTDSAGSPATANSSAYPVLLPSTLRPSINLGFIGDSIVGYNNSGAYDDAPWQETLKYLQGILGQKHIVNQSSSVNQSVSGTKTADWVSAGTYLPGAKTAFAAQSVTHVLIMLGTNDANIAVSASTYLSNLSSCVNDLVSAGYIVVLCVPPWRDQQAGSGQILDVINGLLYDYQAQIASLVNGTTILQGDRTAYNYFSQHTDEFHSAGVHPNQAGIASYGRFWGYAMAVALGLIGAGGNRGVLSGSSF